MVPKGDVYDRAMTTTLLNFQFNSKELIKNAIIGYALYELKQFNFEVVRNQLEVFTKRAYDTGISLTHKDWIQHIRSPYCPDCLQNRGILSPSRVNKEFQNYVDFVCVSCGLVFSFDQLCDEKVSYPLRLNPPSE